MGNQEPEEIGRSFQPADILIVDDDRLFLEVVGDSLSSYGYNITKAESGEEAVSILSEHDLDVVVCDLKMPGMDGLAVLRHVGEHAPDTEVIILTGYADLESAISCVRLGAFDIVRKEKDMPELLTTVNRAVERRRLRSVSSLHEACSVIFSVDDRSDLPERIVRVSTQVMEADDASLMLLDINGELYVAYSNGLPSNLQLSSRTIVGTGIAGRIAADRNPAIIQGLPSETDRFADTEPAQSRKIFSSLIYPLHSGTKLLGVLNLNRLEPSRRPFRTADLNKAELLASQIVLALENQILIRRVTAADKFTAVGQLSTAIAHEINNPVTFVMGGIEFAADTLKECFEPGTPKLPDSGSVHSSTSLDRRKLDEILSALSDALEGAVRIRDVVRDLRSMVRSETEAKEPFDVNDSIHAALRISAAELRSTAEVSLELGDELTAMGSRGALSQVFVNLFVNAAHAMKESGSQPGLLKVQSHRGSQSVVIMVSDNGPGIAPENLARVFEPFFTTKPVGVGTGLGLPTCRDILEWHEGEMKVRSTVGKGTTFEIYLPLYDQRDSEDEASARNPAEPASDTIQEKKRARILVIDDEDGVCRIMTRILKNHDVYTAPNGDEALQLILSDDNFDLILCDVVMPVMTGIELFEHIEKQHPALVDCFFFMTGSAGYANVREFAAEHGITIIEKPIEKAKIIDLASKSIAPGFREA